jgi:hypothetical protein
MGRIKINTELKKQNLSVTISSETAMKLEALQIKNTSKLINWLLIEYFGINNKKN